MNSLIKRSVQAKGPHFLPDLGKLSRSQVWRFVVAILACRQVDRPNGKPSQGINILLAERKVREEYATTTPIEEVAKRLARNAF